jgi:hypothetical protein
MRRYAVDHGVPLMEWPRIQPGFFLQRPIESPYNPLKKLKNLRYFRA